MGYRSNIGCLWILLLIFLVGGSPLLVGVLRLLVGFVLLLVIGGGLLTWWIRRQAVLRYTGSQGQRHNRFVELLVALLVRLAEIDGELDSSEVTAIRLFFQRDLGYQDERLLWVRDLIKASRRSAVAIAEICGEMRASYAMHERFIALQALARVAEADGRVTADELAFIETVSAELGLDPFMHAFGGFAGGQRFGTGGADTQAAAASRVDEALAMLGMTRGASADEIKQAWRKLSMENHPDRAAHLGDEFRKLAGERMSQINKAYETLKEAGLAG